MSKIETQITPSVIDAIEHELALTREAGINSVSIEVLPKKDGSVTLQIRALGLTANRNIATNNEVKTKF